MTRVRGFTLIEMLIAITLSVLVMGGLMSVFLGAKTSLLSTSGVGSVSESGRVAIDFIARSVRGAGAIGCAPSSTTTSSLNVTAANTLTMNFGEAMAAFEAAGTAPTENIVLPAVPSTAGAWLPALDPLLVNLPNPPVAGSDVLVIHTTLEQPQVMAVTSILPAATTFTVNNAAVPITGPGTLQAGNLAVISDCSKSSVFQVSAIGGTVIGHAAGGGVPGNSSAQLSQTFGAGALVYVPDTIVYYIGVGADGDGALFSVNLNGQGVFGAPQELVPDVENMQLLFGVDTTGNGAVTQYFKAQDVADYNTVISVKVAILAATPANSLPPPPPATAPITYNLLGTTVQAPVDRRARKVFDATIAVRSTAS